MYLRDGQNLRLPRHENVTVTPKFPQDFSNDKRVAFELRAQLECSDFWVEAPGHIVMSSEGKNFNFRVDASALEPGAHYAEIRGIHPQRKGLGPLFRIPITVVVPSETPTLNPFYEV